MVGKVLELLRQGFVKWEVIKKRPVWLRVTKLVDGNYG